MCICSVSLFPDCMLYGEGLALLCHISYLVANGLINIQENETNSP